MIAGQEVTAELPEKLVGLYPRWPVNATNESGVVSYTVRVPAGLNADQKKTLESANHLY